MLLVQKTTSASEPANAAVIRPSSQYIVILKSQPHWNTSRKLQMNFPIELCLYETALYNQFFSFLIDYKQFAIDFDLCIKEMLLKIEFVFFYCKFQFNGIFPYL